MEKGLPPIAALHKLGPREDERKIFVMPQKILFS